MSSECNSVVLCYSYQDTHNRAYYMVLAGTRWLGIRLDLLSALLIGAVAFFAALYFQNNGKKMFHIVPCFLVLCASLKLRKFLTLLRHDKGWSSGIVPDNVALNFLIKIAT